jgi:peroxiredoxin
MAMTGTIRGPYPIRSVLMSLSVRAVSALVVTGFLLAAGAGVAGATEIPGPNLHVGDNALLFSLPAVNEDAAMRVVLRPHVALSDFTGVAPGFPARVVVLQFTKKGGDDIAALDRLQKKYGNRGLRAIAIVSDTGDLAGLSSWVQSQHLDVPVLRDAYDIVVKRYGVTTFPMTFVIDGDGYVDAIGVDRDTLETSVEAIVQPFLK